MMIEQRKLFKHFEKNERLILKALDNESKVIIYGPSRDYKENYSKYLMEQYKQLYIEINAQYIKDIDLIYKKVIQQIIKKELDKNNHGKLKIKYGMFKLNIYYNFFNKEYDVDISLINQDLTYKSCYDEFFEKEVIKNKVVLVVFNTNLLNQNIIVRLFEKWNSKMLICYNVDNYEKISNDFKEISKHSISDIPESSLFKACLELFKKKNIYLGYDVFKIIMKNSGELLNDQIDLINKIFEYSEDHSAIDETFVINAVDNIAFLHSEIYMQLFDNLDDLEQSILKVFANDSNSKIYGKELLEKMGNNKIIHNMSLSRKMDVLIERQILYKKNRMIFFKDPFFKRWVLKNLS